MSTRPNRMRACPSRSTAFVVQLPFVPVLKQGELAARRKSPAAFKFVPYADPGFTYFGSFLVLPPTPSVNTAAGEQEYPEYKVPPF